MATISFAEIKKLLAGEGDREDTSFVEIRFDDARRESSGIDEEMKNRVITADCTYGSVTLVFDERGQLRSVEIT
jgi:hypothetical protein